MTEKQVNTIRAKVQKEALKSIELNTGKGSLLVMATGAGKSKIPIDYAKKKKNKVKSIALIVPTERLRDEGWHNEFIKWGAQDLWANVTSLCYASASKIALQKFDLVILDESHNITQLSATFFINNKFNKIIAITATPPKEYEKQELLSRIGLRKTYELPLDKAVELGFVAPYKITVYYTKLDNINKNVIAGSKDKPFYQTEFANYNWINNQIIQMEFEGKMGTPKYNMFLLKRMRAIYNSRSKTTQTTRILREIPMTDRTLIFCGSIEQAESVCPYTYHSKNGRKDIDDFVNLEINRLSCVSALNEGENLPGIDSAIITQVNSKERTLVQRIGRLIRYRPNHEAHIHIICCKDTQDEVWLGKAMENIDKSIIEFKYI